MSAKLCLNSFLTEFLSIPPQKIAFKYWNDQKRNFKNFTYQEFSDTVKKISAVIPELSRQPKVMIIGSKGYFSSAAILSTWLKGGYYLPASLNTPVSKLEKLIKVFDPDIFLVEKVTSEIANILRKYSSKKEICIFNNDRPEIHAGLGPVTDFKNLVAKKIDFKIRPDDSISYVMTTSGTSGEPKYIAVKDKQVSSYYNNVMNLLPKSKPHGILQNFEITFDPSVGDLLWGITKQAYFIPLCTADIRNLNSILSEEGNLWWSSTPSYADWTLRLIQLNKENHPTQFQNQISHSFFLGERLTAKTCHNWKDVFVSSEIHNLYGPTETTISISFHTYSQVDDSYTFIPIGEIHSDHKYEIDRNQVLTLTGPQVCDGYLVPVPESINFQKLPNTDNSFKTGDLCEVKNQKLIILGRADSQIKLHGQRFELEEMENFLRSKKLEVILVPILNSDGEIEGIGATTTDVNIALEGIQNSLAQNFEHIFYPKDLIKLDEFPLNENHKVDRKKLAALFKA